MCVCNEDLDEDVGRRERVIKKGGTSPLIRDVGDHKKRDEKRVIFEILFFELGRKKKKRSSKSSKEDTKKNKKKNRV